MITVGSAVEFVGKGANPIVPVGTKGIVERATRNAREILVRWDCPDEVMATRYTMNWHTSYSKNVKAVA